MISRHYTDKNRSDLKPVVHFLALKTRLDPKQKTWNKCWTLTSPLCVRFPPLWLSAPPLIDFTCSPLPHVEIVLVSLPLVPVCLVLSPCQSRPRSRQVLFTSLSLFLKILLVNSFLCLNICQVKTLFLQFYIFHYFLFFFRFDFLFSSLVLISF